jgi:hypothetical protein
MQYVIIYLDQTYFLPIFLLTSPHFILLLIVFTSQYKFNLLNYFISYPFSFCFSFLRSHFLPPPPTLPKYYRFKPSLLSTSVSYWSSQSPGPAVPFVYQNHVLRRLAYCSTLRMYAARSSETFVPQTTRGHVRQ